MEPQEVLKESKKQKMADSGKSETNVKDSFKSLSLKPIFTPVNLALKYKKASKKEKTKSEVFLGLFPIFSAKWRFIFS